MKDGASLSDSYLFVVLLTSYFVLRTGHTVRGTFTFADERPKNKALSTKYEVQLTFLP